MSHLDPTTPSAPTVSPRASAAWKVAASAAAGLLLVFGVTQTLSALAHGERTISRTFAADGIERIEVDLSSGSIEVVAADVDEITVTATLSDGFRETGAVQEVVDDRLVLTGTCPLYLSAFCAVDYDVRVPKDVAVVARVDDGSIRVVGLSGAVDVFSDNSGVELVGLRGPVTVHSANGSLTGEDLQSPSVEASTENGSVDLGFTAAPDTVLATSENGWVEVRLPDVVGDYRVDAGTDNGSTEIGVATDPASSRSVVLRSDNGDLRVLPSVGGDR